MATLKQFSEQTGQYELIPLDDCRIIESVKISDFDDWMSEKSLQPIDGANTFLLEIATDNPYGKYGEFVPGLFQLAFSIPYRVKEVNLDTMKVIYVDNFDEYNFSDRTVIGKLAFEWKGENVIINGNIEFLSSNSKTRKSVSFANFVLKLTDVNDYRIAENLKEEIRKEQEKNILQKIIEPVIIQKDFFDSLFSLTQFPNNDITFKFSKSRKKKFQIDQSYVVQKSKISDKASDELMDLLSSGIYHPIGGQSFVFNFHYFDEGDSNIFDDETNYSLLFSLPDIKSNTTYNVTDPSVTVNLSYWHYGPFGQVIDTKKVEGEIFISSKKQYSISGILNFTCKMTDKQTVEFNGNFQIPLIDRSTLMGLTERVEKLPNEK